MIRSLCLILQFATAIVAASAAGQTLEPDKQRLSGSFEPIESWYPKESGKPRAGDWESTALHRHRGARQGADPEGPAPATVA